MRALPFERLGLGIEVREPQRRAVVVAHREPVALRREGEAAHGGRRLIGLLPALVVARGHVLAGAPGDAAALVERQRVDPGTAGRGELARRAVAAGHGDAAAGAAGAGPPPPPAP